ncbi:MAG: peptidoglycan DD-metalloendopeptidase family protein [Synergistetes bacterium]|nr:peptidoglycan DD-metalloendopeptidase family protein [Synergistota bacterium]
MRGHFSKFVIFMISLSSLFLFLSWRECENLWAVKRGICEEPRYDWEKEEIIKFAKEVPYDLVGVDVSIGAGIASAMSLEVPPLPEVKSLVFVAFSMEGNVGRGLDVGISLSDLKNFSLVGVKYLFKAGLPRSGSLSLKVDREIETKIKKTSPVKVFTYVVKPGDTLWDIARKFKITVDTLISANKLKRIDLLKIGQVIKVPNVPGVFHKVSKGETLKKIARMYKVKLESIKKYNPNVKTLKPGMLVFIPGGKLKRGGLPSRPRWLASRLSRKRFIWPVYGRITSKFGWRRSPFSRRMEFHPGLDIRGAVGKPIRASRSGRVKYAGWQRGYGLVIVVDHGGGWETRYAHCSRIYVRVGQYVRQGQIIGRVGNTGRSTGPHLHFEIRNRGRPVNPLYYLR